MLSDCKLSGESCGDEQIRSFNDETTCLVLLSWLILREISSASVISLKVSSKPCRIYVWISWLTRSAQSFSSRQALLMELRSFCISSNITCGSSLQLELSFSTLSLMVSWVSYFCWGLGSDFFTLDMLNISNGMCYTMYCMLEWMRKRKHRIGTL